MVSSRLVKGGVKTRFQGQLGFVITLPVSASYWRDKMTFFVGIEIFELRKLESRGRDYFSNPSSRWKAQNEKHESQDFLTWKCIWFVSDGNHWKVRHFESILDCVKVWNRYSLVSLRRAKAVFCLPERGSFWSETKQRAIARKRRAQPYISENSQRESFAALFRRHQPDTGTL